MSDMRAVHGRHERLSRRTHGSLETVLPLLHARTLAACFILAGDNLILHFWVIGLLPVAHLVRAVAPNGAYALARAERAAQWILRC